MANTQHGHQIKGSPVVTYFGVYIKCGGVRVCQKCKADSARYHHPSNTNK